MCRFHKGYECTETIYGADCMNGAGNFNASIFPAHYQCRTGATIHTCLVLAKRANMCQSVTALPAPAMYYIDELLLVGIQSKTEACVVKLSTPGSLPRLQRKKYRRLNHKLIDLCAAYKSCGNFMRFQKWISQLALCTPDCKK